MTIEYYTKNVYGNELIYLVESPETNVVLRLIGQKTISSYQMSLFESLGVNFTRVFEPQNEILTKIRGTK